MGNYKEIILGEEAKNYVEKHLSYGQTLSKLVLEYIDLKLGNVITGLPSDANLDKINDFDSGGILPAIEKSKWRTIVGEDGVEHIMKPIPRNFSYAVNIIGAFLKGNKDRLCVFENVKAGPSDPILLKHSSAILTFKKEVYHVLTNREISEEEVVRAIKESESLWTFVGFMTSLQGIKKESLSSKELSSEAMKILAENVEKIIVGAYDGEGFLIWHSIHHSSTVAQ